MCNLEQEYDAELLENNDDDVPGPLDQQPTPDNRGDSDLTMGNTMTRPPETSAQPSGPPATSAGQYNVGVGIFDSGFESMFASEQAPKHDAGLSDLMRQYSQMPFGFATSNLR